MTDSFYARVKEEEKWEEKDYREWDKYMEEHPITGDDRKSGLV